MRTLARERRPWSRRGHKATANGKRGEVGISRQRNALPLKPLVTSPKPNGFLWSVSCTGAASCVAVGNRGGKMFTLRWNGTTWSIVASPNPTGSDQSDLTAVKCTSATNCFAVGYHNTVSSTYKTLIEHWNGISWSISTSPNATGDISWLKGVSCSTATSCFAVGDREMHSFQDDETLVERHS